MHQEYKTLRNALLYGLTALSIYACGGGGGGNNNTNPQQPPTQPQPVIGENYITSVYGTATLKFNNGIVVYKDSKTTTKANNLGNTTVVLPHNGGSATLTISNGDDQKTYAYITENGTNAYNTNSITIVSTNAQWKNISGYDATNNQAFNNEPMIEITHNANTENVNLSFTGNEGETKTYDNFRLYDLINQGNNNVLDLGDYFTTFSVYFNKMPDVRVISTAECPSNVDAQGNVYIPSNGTCITFEITNTDNIGTNHQYKLSNETLWNDITQFPYVFNHTLTLNPGENAQVSIDVKEDIGSANNTTVSDIKTYAFNVFKELSQTLNAYCIDTLTNNTWEIANGDTCVFVDPKGNTGDLYFVRITYNDTGNCEVRVSKDGNLANTVTASCSNLVYEHPVNASEKGTGVHTLTFEIYKDYGGNKVLVDSLTMYYRVNVAPTLSFFLQPATMKDGTTAYKFYVNESINGSVQGSDGDLFNPLTCYFDYNNDGTVDQTINNCENAQNFTISYTSPGTYTIKVTVTDGVDSTSVTQTVSIYEYPSITVRWRPEVIFVGETTTFEVIVNNPGIVDDNASECLLTVDYFCDGYVDATVNGCSTGVVYSITDTPPVSFTRTDCAEFEDYRGTKVNGSATLDVWPLP